MAGKRSKNKNQPRENKSTTSSSARIMQIIFLVLSVMIVLSMVLAATSSLF